MKKLIVYTDGGSRGNPGLAAIGVVIADEKKNILKEYSQYLGDNLTNNEAEYKAVIFALKKIKALFGKKKIGEFDVEIMSDSELLIKQMQGLYKILEPKIQSLFVAVWNLKIDFKEVKFKLISREKNKEADKLVNEALDNQNRAQTLI
ncbi:MAG: hypothetical protein COU98_00020 [Candidatus Staskawiczbacteria bacterium CG10_big_fil_rev_8_21_14_0_10_38_10]|uniref:RNase H type-1 domain-containing protein n=1 Tax=Candidatus Staskawiczbacteria bacterium CG10_big_fil_rev_8_21_14_0_10_38_10 TaxID=1974891 RepID=A0A2H9T246_9BACT|nr:MAG: hypothetical protein COU98_00020 [Candidatus Staskawiczbacteria bacterium CG10_big_fil_rev_8_21_14_0_10_38_10]